MSDKRTRICVLVDGHWLVGYQNKELEQLKPYDDPCALAIEDVWEVISSTNVVISPNGSTGLQRFTAAIPVAYASGPIPRMLVIISAIFHDVEQERLAELIQRALDGLQAERAARAGIVLPQPQVNR